MRSAFSMLALAALPMLPAAAAAAEPDLAPQIALPPLPVELVIEAEPNATLRQAQAVPLGELGSIVTGTLRRAADVDTYRLDLPIGRCVVALLTPNPLADDDLELINSFGLVLARSSNRGPGQIEILPTCGLPFSTTYYLRVVYAAGEVGPLTGAYSIEIGSDGLFGLLPSLPSLP